MPTATNGEHQSSDGTCRNHCCERCCPSQYFCIIQQLTEFRRVVECFLSNGNAWKFEIPNSRGAAKRATLNVAAFFSKNVAVPRFKITSGTSAHAVRRSAHAMLFARVLNYCEKRGTATFSFFSGTAAHARMACARGTAPILLSWPFRSGAILPACY